MLNDLTTALGALEIAADEDAVWETVSDFLKKFGVATLVYRYLPTAGPGACENDIIVEKSISPGGSRNFDFIKFAYEKEYHGRRVNLKRTRFWKKSYLLSRIYDNDNDLERCYSIENELSGIIMPGVANGGRRAIFILAFEDPGRRYETAELHCMSVLCNKAHQTLSWIYMEALREQIQLSKREVEILTCIVLGRSNLEIASSTGLSRHTVDSYLRRVFLKIGVSDRTSAAVAAISNDLISEPFNRLAS